MQYDYFEKKYRAKYPDAPDKEIQSHFDVAVGDLVPQVEQPMTQAMSGGDATFGNLLSDVWATAKDLPAQIGGSFAALMEGGDPRSVYGEKDWKDDWIKDARSSAMETSLKAGGRDSYADFLGISITRDDIRNFSQNAAYSLTSLAASLGAGVATAPIPVFGSSVAAAGAAGAVSGYRMDTNNILRNLRNGMDAESQKQLGRPLSDQEFISIAEAPEMQAQAKEIGLAWTGKGNIESLVSQHGAHEAGWEAIGNVITLGTGKALFSLARKSGVFKPLLTAAGGLAGELATETETQIGQHNAEMAMGLNPDGTERSYLNLDDQVKSLREVAPATLLLTGGLQGMTYGAGKLMPKDEVRPQPTPQQLPQQDPVIYNQMAGKKQSIWEMLPADYKVTLEKARATL